MLVMGRVGGYHRWMVRTARVLLVAMITGACGSSGAPSPGPPPGDALPASQVPATYRGLFVDGAAWRYDVRLSSYVADAFGPGQGEGLGETGSLRCRVAALVRHADDVSSEVRCEGVPDDAITGVWISDAAGLHHGDELVLATSPAPSVDVPNPGGALVTTTLGTNPAG